MQKQFLRIKKKYEKQIIVIDDTVYYAHFNRGEWRDKEKVNEVGFYRDYKKIYCKLYFDKISFKLENIEHRLVKVALNTTFYGQEILDVCFQVKIADTWVSFTREYIPNIVFDPYRDAHYSKENYLHLIAPTQTTGFDKLLCDKYQEEKIKERLANHEKRKVKDNEITKRELEKKLKSTGKSNLWKIGLRTPMAHFVTSCFFL